VWGLRVSVLLSTAMSASHTGMLFRRKLAYLMDLSNEGNTRRAMD
jgi:hypothetical protein